VTSSGEGKQEPLDFTVQPGDTDALEIVTRETGLPRDEAERLVSFVQRYTGPMPPPELLRGYEVVVAGSAERIVKMAEQEQQFRHEMTRAAVQGGMSGVKRGQLFALMVVAIMTVASVICAALDQAVVASVLGGGTLVSLVAAFLGQQILTRDSGQLEQPDV
jgi:uncharacterized membrane protein